MDPMQLLMGMASGGRQQQSTPKISNSFDTSLKNTFETSFKTSTSRQHTVLRKISTNEDARGLLRAMMTRELGRRPTASEVDKFQGALNAAQRNNPFVTDSTTTGSEYDMGGSQDQSSGWSGGWSLAGSKGGASNAGNNSMSNSTSNSWSNSNSNSNTDTTESGGVDPQLFAEDYVINNDPNSEYGKYQAATTYANALFSAIRSPV